MTLILSITTPLVSLHASDRRVTLVGGAAAPTIYSPLENKTIIFLAHDAVGTIGFTGIAFVGQQATDQWIANTIAPQFPGSPPLDTFAFGGRGLGRAKLGTIIWRLNEAFAEIPRLLQQHGLKIQIAGHRLRRGHIIPFCVEIEWKGSGPTIGGSMRLPRTRQQKCMFGQIGDGWPVEKTAKTVANNAEATGHKDVEAIRMAAMMAIRKRSAETMTVGSDLMTVVVPNPTISGEIVWRFEPVDLHEAAIVGPNINQKFQAIYSPWIITPVAVNCPCIGTGGVVVEWRGFKVACGNEEKAIGSGILFATSHQQRPLPPGHKPH